MQEKIYATDYTMLFHVGIDHCQGRLDIVWVLFIYTADTLELT